MSRSSRREPPAARDLLFLTPLTSTRPPPSKQTLPPPSPTSPPAPDRSLILRWGGGWGVGGYKIGGLKLFAAPPLSRQGKTFAHTPLPENFLCAPPPPPRLPLWLNVQAPALKLPQNSLCPPSFTLQHGQIFPPPPRPLFVGVKLHLPPPAIHPPPPVINDRSVSSRHPVVGGRL